MSTTDRILDIIDAGLQRSTETGMTRGDPEWCARCQSERPVEDGDTCPGCRAWLLGDSDEDPAFTTQPVQRALTVTVEVDSSALAEAVQAISREITRYRNETALALVEVVERSARANGHDVHRLGFLGVLRGLPVGEPLYLSQAELETLAAARPAPPPRQPWESWESWSPDALGTFGGIPLVVDEEKAAEQRARVMMEGFRGDVLAERVRLQGGLCHPAGHGTAVSLHQHRLAVTPPQ